MLGGNGFWNTIASHWKQGVIGLILLAMAACGITLPMLAIDNTNETQDAQLSTLQEQVNINAGDLDANAALIVALQAAQTATQTQLEAHLVAYELYKLETGKTLSGFGIKITRLERWVEDFYGIEWPKFLEKWEQWKQTENASWTWLSNSLTAMKNDIAELQAEE